MYLFGSPPAKYVFSQLAAGGPTPQASQPPSRGSSDPREAAFFLILEHPEGMPEGKTVLVSGTPAGVRGMVMAVLSGGLRFATTTGYKAGKPSACFMVWTHHTLC